MLYRNEEPNMKKWNWIKLAALLALAYPAARAYAEDAAMLPDTHMDAVFVADADAKADNVEAVPASASERDHTILHLKRREFFAAAALQGILAQPREGRMNETMAADIAVIYADALCKRLGDN